MVKTKVTNVGGRTNMGTRLLSLILVLSLLMSSMFAFPAPSFAQSKSNDSGELDSSTIFSVASAATNYIDIMLVNGHAGDVSGSGFTVGNAAGGMGAVDTDSLKTLTNDSALSEQSANNVSTRAYGSAGKSASDLEQKVTAYSRYGAALAYLGLDETAPEQTSDLFRMISGRMLQFFWFMSNGVDAIMGWACKILQALNPFGFLDGAKTPAGSQTIVSQFTDSADLQDVSTGQYQADTGMGGVFNRIQRAFSDLYNSVARISWMYLMPLFFALAVFAIVFGKAVDQSMYQKGRSQARRWIVRVIFILAAVPLLGGIYTPLLNGMTKAFLDSESSTNVNADRIVASQLVDFQAWAYASRLSVDGLSPAIEVTYNDGDKLDVNSVPVDNCMVAVRKYASTINSRYGGIALSTNGTGISNSGAGQVVQSASGSNGMLNTGASSTTIGARTLKLNGNSTIHDRLSNLLERYSTGARYDSATYASVALMDLSGSASDKNAIGAVVREWRLIASDPTNYAENLETSLQTQGTNGNTTEVKPRGFMGEDATADISKGKFVRINGGNKEDMSQKLADAYKEAVDSGDWAAFEKALDEAMNQENEATDATPGADNQAEIDSIHWLSDGTLQFSGGKYSSSGEGLSTIGMYNYLSTVFATDGMHIYSSKETQNLPSRASHYAVSSVGSGTYGMLLMADSIVLLMTFTLVGLAYAISMLFSNFKRGIQALISLPFAMLGVLNSMARVVMLIFMMIVDLCTVFFLYQLVCQGLGAVNDAMTNSVLNLSQHLTSTMIPASMNSWLPADGIGSQVAVACIMLLLAMAILIGFMILALRIRRGIINVSNEMISRVTEKIFESRGGTDAKSNVGQKAAAGAAIGASMMVRGGGGVAAAGLATAGGLGAGMLASASGLGKGASGSANLTGSAKGDDSSTKAAGTGIAGLSRQSGVAGGMISGTVSGDQSGTVSNTVKDAGFDTSYGHGESATSSSMGGEGATGGNASATMTAAAMALGQGGDAAGGTGAGGVGGVGVGTAASNSASSSAGQGGEGAEGIGVGGTAKSVTAAYGGIGAGGSASYGEADGVYGVTADSSQAPMQTAGLKTLGGAQDSQYAPGAYAPGQGEGSLSAVVAGYGGSSSASVEGSEGGAFNVYGNVSDTSAVYGVSAQPASYGTPSPGTGSQADANSSADGSAYAAGGTDGAYGYGQNSVGYAAQTAGVKAGDAATSSASASGKADSVYGYGSEEGINAAGGNAYGQAGAGGNTLSVATADAQGAQASAEGGAQNQFAPDNMNSAEANAQTDGGLQNASLEANQEAPRGIQAGSPAVNVDAQAGDVSMGNLSGAVFDSSQRGGMSVSQEQKMARATADGVRQGISSTGGAVVPASYGAPSSAPGSAGQGGGAGAPGVAGAGGGAGAPGTRGVPGHGQVGLGTSVDSTRSDGLRHAKAAPGGGMPKRQLSDSGTSLAGVRGNRATAAAEHAEQLRRSGGASLGSESFNSAPSGVRGADLGSAVNTQRTSLSPSYGGRSGYSEGGTTIANGRMAPSGFVDRQVNTRGSSYSGGYTPSAGYGGGSPTPLSDSYSGVRGGYSPSDSPTHGVTPASYSPSGNGGTNLNAQMVNSASKVDASEELRRQAIEERFRQRSLEGTNLRT